MTTEDGNDVPVFDLEVTFDSETNSITITANEYAAAYLADLFLGLQQGSPRTHYHITQDVEGMSGNVYEILLMKR
jgi:hypothetical protein